MWAFIRQVLATIVGLILFATLGLAGLIFLVVSASWLFEREPEASVEDDSILTLNLSAGITDANREVPVRVAGFLSGEAPERPLALRVALDAIAHAATDDNITALVIEGNLSSGTGYATLRELRDALEAFQESGKPIYAYNRIWGERDYYLASLADHLYLNPNGVMELNGFSSETTFFAGALDQYGIGVQVLRAGQYKSAVEPFVRQSSSPEETEQTEALLADIWQVFVSETAESRELSPQTMQAIAESQAIVLAATAQEDGLVDELRYPDEVLSELLTLTGTDDPEDLNQISLSAYAAVTDAGTVNRSSRNKIALVYVDGDIVSSANAPTQVGGDRFLRLLRELRRDDSIKAVVLRINSPGGSAFTADTLAREVQLLGEAKPTIASMGNVAASGGYQMATFAEQIFASPNTITGSIGVFGLLFNVQELANDNGITWDGTKTAQYADFDTISRPKTPAELAIQQRLVDQLYNRFLQTVADSRPLSLEEVQNVAQGRVWSGEDAQAAGLVDELGGLQAALDAAATAAELGDDWQLQEYPEAEIFSTFSLLSWGSRLAARANPDPLTEAVQQVRQELDALQALDDPAGAYMRLPFNPVLE